MEPATLIIVIAVIATVAFVATLWTYIKCVQTTEQPDRFTDCMNNAMNVYNQALATAEQHRQNCLRTCAFGICTPAFICDGAKATEVAAATAILWASQAVCYAVA